MDKRKLKFLQLEYPEPMEILHLKLIKKLHTLIRAIEVKSMHLA